MRFKNWLLKENATRTGSKLGLYPTTNDALGQSTFIWNPHCG